MGWDYEKPSRQKRREKKGWKRPRKKRLTRSTCQADTTDSLKNLGSTPALLLQKPVFLCPHSARRASVRLAWSMGVSGIREDPDAPKCVESTPTHFRVVVNLKNLGGHHG